MSIKLAGVLFLVVCVAVRFYRARLQPLFAVRLPGAAPAVNREISSVEDLATHELALILANRFKTEADTAKAQAEAEAILARVRSVLDPQAAAATDPKT